MTGGCGFLGSHVVKNLKNRGVNGNNLILFDIDNYNISEEKEVEKLFKDNSDIDIVIHLAGDVGGIEYNRKNPGSIIFNNIMMNTLIMEYSRRFNVEKFVGIGSVCSYPKYTPIPFKEENLWDGYPEETNAPYGLSKKVMLIQGQSYRQQYGFNAIHLLMINLYGPGDNFSLDNSHVIPALIRKFIEAKKEGRKEVIVWGTGEPSREFLYVEDAAEGILLATEFYDEPEPVNLGAGFEIKIKNLVNLIAELSGFEGTIKWDTTKPDGQPRRMLDTSRAKEKFNFQAKTDFKEGLKKTIEWYESSGLVK